MLSGHSLLMALVVGSLMMPTAALSESHGGAGNNNGNGNLGSGNGNCNSGSNNGNGNIGNNEGNGSPVPNDIQRKQLKQLQEQLKDIPLGLDILKLLPTCPS